MAALETQIANRRQQSGELEATQVRSYPHPFEFDLESSDVHLRFTNSSSIRDVILFPLLRPWAEGEDEDEGVGE